MLKERSLIQGLKQEIDIVGTSALPYEERQQASQLFGRIVLEIL
jgi:hypothetical protein